MSPTISPPHVTGFGWITRTIRYPHMIFERIAAWMLVAVYHTVFLGIIVLGLRGAL